MQGPNVIAAADRAIGRARAVAFIVGEMSKREHHSAPIESSRAVGGLPPSRPAAISPAFSLVAVMQCIRDHESGNYAESSHLSDGSGAYQYIPSTWREWSARAGYGGYAYAFEAPAAVQDAVTAFTLTHGGAHNWDPRYGNDPCTAGLP